MAWEDEEFVLALPGGENPAAPVAVEVKKVVEVKVKVEHAAMWDDGCPVAAGGGGGVSWEDDAQEYEEGKAAAEEAAEKAAIARAKEIARLKAAKVEQKAEREAKHNAQRWKATMKFNEEINDQTKARPAIACMSWTNWK